MMSGVFLSYRRDDSGDDARRIHRRLADRFGDGLVYIDVEDIPLGVNFLDHITEALRQASYVLVAIGPRWLLLTDEEGRQRLRDPDDPVRYEIRTALQSKRPVVPMLLGGARMPRKNDLPAEIADLVMHNGIAIRPDPDFESDVDALMGGLHLDRIDEKRVPTVFKVGLVARNLGYGGSVGWAILGAVVGITRLEELGFWYPVLLALVGGLAGWIGGWSVGFLTGQLIKHKAPPLIARRVRRMGLGWSLGLTLALVPAAAIGVFLGLQVYEDILADAEGLEAIGAALGGILVVALITLGVMFLGLILASGLAAAYFARRLRLRSEEISRGRGFAIAMVWAIGGIITGIGWISGIAYVDSLLEGL